MTKKISCILVAVFCFISTVFSTLNGYAEEEEEIIYPSPTTFMNAGQTLRLGEIGYGSITCITKIGLKDCEIKTDDITVYGYGLIYNLIFCHFINKITILSVSEPRISSDNYVYEWDITYKANFIGRTSLQLKGGAVVDNADYINSINNVSVINVTLF